MGVGFRKLLRALVNGHISLLHVLLHQTQGWDYEFERLQKFTLMEYKFRPGQLQIVDEITSRFSEKERANTSLLRFLHEQEVPREPSLTFSSQCEHLILPPIGFCYSSWS
jgi:hypothetical protein